MLKRILSVVALTALVACQNNSPAQKAAGSIDPSLDQVTIGNKSYIVKLKDRSKTRTRGVLALRGVGALSVLDAHEVGSLVKVQLNADDKAQQLYNLMKSPDVEYVVEDFKVHRLEAPMDLDGLRDQWALAKVNAERAWALAGNKGSHDVIVAVIDTGVDYNHESLRDNMVSGYDFASNDSDPMDVTSQQNPGHGTHCSGIIGATGTVENGTSGISPNVTIMPLRFLDEKGSGDLMNGIKAIDHAIANKANVISASWGASVGASQAQPLIEAVKRASDAGVVFVAAAANDGNDNDETSMYPANANFENTITVAASGPNDEKPQWSNYGEHRVHVASPGLDIISTLPGNKYDKLSGTSMATPLVSGMVALLMAQNPDLTGRDARSILQITGAKVQIETACNCRVDAGAAMEFLLDENMFVSPYYATIQPQETLQFDLVNDSGSVSFRSANPNVATIDQTGLMTGASEGETTIVAIDSNGVQHSSGKIYVKTLTEAVSCPLGDPAICQLFCAIDPTMPWCQ